MNFRKFVMNIELSNFLAEKSYGKKIVLIGELHGTKEIPKLLIKFFSEFIKNNDFNICLEISSSEQNKIDGFLKSGDPTIIKSIFSNSKENDGRRTLEYFDLIKKVYNLNKKYCKNIKIICIDIGKNFYSENFQNDREKIMAKNILDSITKKTFIIVGNIHASKKIIKISNTSIKPTGFYLYKEFKDKMVSINLLPKKGMFYNFSLKQVQNNSFNKFKNNYDFTFYIDIITPATIMKKV